MAKEKRIKFRIELGLGGLVLTIMVTICLMVWMFILGLWLGQNLAVGRAKKAPSPVAEKTLSPKAKKALPESPPTIIKTPPINRNFIETPLPETKEKPAETYTPPPAPEPKPQKKAVAPKKSEVHVSQKSRGSQTKKKILKTFYSLQVASLRNPQEAQRYARKLRARGYEAFVRKVNLKDKGIWYRVHVGRFNSLSEASRFAKKLAQKEGLKSFVVPLKE